MAKETQVVPETAKEDAANSAKGKKGVEKLLKGMKAKLAACNKVTIKVPVNQLNPKDKEVVVQINGYIFQIQRGVSVEVPEPVKELLENGGYI